MSTIAPPTDLDDLADTIAAATGPYEDLDLYWRLRAHVGHDRARQLWQQALSTINARRATR